MPTINRLRSIIHMGLKMVLFGLLQRIGNEVRMSSTISQKLPALASADASHPHQSKRLTSPAQYNVLAVSNLRYLLVIPLLTPRASTGFTDKRFELNRQDHPQEDNSKNIWFRKVMKTHVCKTSRRTGWVLTPRLVTATRQPKLSRKAHQH